MQKNMHMYSVFIYPIALDRYALCHRCRVVAGCKFEFQTSIRVDFTNSAAC